jgi:hypothetical protein
MVQKIKDGGTEGRYMAYVVMDADARRLRIPLAGVSEGDAAAMVATGDSKYVYEVARLEVSRAGGRAGAEPFGTGRR